MGTALMGPDADKIFVAIGVLKAELSNLGEKFDDLHQRTTEEQRKVHDIVVATSESQRIVVRTLDNLQRLVDEMKPLTDDYREKRAEARGAARLAGWLYTAAAAAGGMIALGAGKVFDLISNRPHIPIIVILVGMLAFGKAMAQDVGHRHHPVADMPLHEKFYQNWMMPDNPNKSCCNKADCYWTEVRWNNGHWQAKRREDGKWLWVPDAKVERHRDNPDGRNHLCAPPPGAVSYPPDTVFCFALGSGI